MKKSKKVPERSPEPFLLLTYFRTTYFLFPAVVLGDSLKYFEYVFEK